MKPVTFMGDALSCLRAFPEGARRDAGFQIDRLQQGLEPNDWKPMKSIGAGVREIRVRDPSGAYRVIYIAQMAEATFILHAFQKKSAATSKRDLDLASARFKELMQRTRT
jgi:phage-related protein